MPTFEVRVPTYRRAKLLTRALQSMIAQSETDWIAYVYDDSPDREAKAVVASLNDSRIVYEANEKSLGAAGNIDRAFAKEPRSEASYFAILEDDNFLFPHFLHRGRQLVDSSGCQLIEMNQLIVDEDGQPRVDQETTRGHWFSRGKIAPLDLWASLFLMEGVSNGGLFWSRQSVSELMVGQNMNETCLQEACRTLKINEPIFFESEPCAAWSFLPPAKVVRQSSGTAVVSRGMNELRGSLWRQGRVMREAAINFALTTNNEARLGQAVESFLKPWESGGVGPFDMNRRIRGLVRRFLTPDPVKEFLSKSTDLFRVPVGNDDEPVIELQTSRSSS